MQKLYFQNGTIGTYGVGEVISEDSIFSSYDRLKQFIAVYTDHYNLK